jgi:hypothetical protein
MRKTLEQLKVERDKANRQPRSPASSEGAWKALTTHDRYKRALDRTRGLSRFLRDP